MTGNDKSILYFCIPKVTGIESKISLLAMPRFSNVTEGE